MGGENCQQGLTGMEAVTFIQQQVKGERWQHIEGVRQQARRLALIHGLEPEKAEQAALWHDVARDYPPERLLELARQQGLELDADWLAVPMLLHGPVGAQLAAEQGVRDKEVLQAIARHTLGHPEATALDKLLFVADMIEPGRDYPGVEELRLLAARDLEGAYLAGLDHTLRYLLERQQYIHPLAVRARNAQLLRLKAREVK
ncbi:phosphohydrolase [Carboxydocella sp. ULO1]|nr:phosphohydrolase [Carboxydocella sp. ULO1]